MSIGTRFYLKTDNSLLKTIISSACTVLKSVFACLHYEGPAQLQLGALFQASGI